MPAWLHGPMAIRWHLPSDVIRHCASGPGKIHSAAHAVTDVVDSLVDVAGVMNHHPPDVAHRAASAAFVPSRFSDQPIAESFSQHVLQPYGVARESPISSGRWRWLAWERTAQHIPRFVPVLRVTVGNAEPCTRWANSPAKRALSLALPYSLARRDKNVSAAWSIVMRDCIDPHQLSLPPTVSPALPFCCWK